MAVLTPIVGKSVKSAVKATAATVKLAMARGTKYRFCSSVPCWIAQGDSSAKGFKATTGDGSMYLGADEVVQIDGDDGPALSVVRHAGDGDCTLTPLRWH